MKKRLYCLITLILFIISVLALTACGNGVTGGENSAALPNENENAMIEMTIGGNTFAVTLYETETARAFADMLPLNLEMSAMAHEKYYNLPKNLPTDAEGVGRIREGDLMLWGVNCLVLFYETFDTSYSYTRIGRVENTARLASAVGSGSVTIKFEIKTI